MGNDLCTDATSRAPFQTRLASADCGDGSHDGGGAGRSVAPHRSHGHPALGASRGRQEPRTCHPASFAPCARVRSQGGLSPSGVANGLSPTSRGLYEVGARYPPRGGLTWRSVRSPGGTLCRLPPRAEGRHVTFRVEAAEELTKHRQTGSLTDDHVASVDDGLDQGRRSLVDGTCDTDYCGLAVP